MLFHLIGPSIHIGLFRKFGVSVQLFQLVKGPHGVPFADFQNGPGLPLPDLGCSGFVYGLALAKGLVVGGMAKNVLLLTAETYTK